MARVLHAAAARLAVRAVLPAERRVHDAGVPRAPVQSGRPQLLHLGVDHRVRPDQISVTLFAGGIVMRELTGYSVWTSAVLLIVLTGTYTVLGRLRAELYTCLL